MGFQWPTAALSSTEGLRSLRQAILESIFKAGNGHPGGSLSLVEILASIFDGSFMQDPKNPNLADRDRFVLSKGHGVPALYSVLSYLGYFAPAELVQLRQIGHFLQGHPDRNRYPIMEASTGSLGQGASIALGLALGLRVSFEKKEIARLPRVYCVLGDGEMQEGQVWECLMAAAKFQPGNLIFILDNNKSQIDGPVEQVMPLEPLIEKIRSFNLDVVRVDGHNVQQLRNVFSDRVPQPQAKPLFVIADTVKGKGISFMEGQIGWHGAAPSREQLEKALNELSNVGTSGAPAGSSFGRLVD